VTTLLHHIAFMRNMFSVLMVLIKQIAVHYSAHVKPRKTIKPPLPPVWPHAIKYFCDYGRIYTTWNSADATSSAEFLRELRLTADWNFSHSTDLCPAVWRRHSRPESEVMSAGHLFWRAAVTVVMAVSGAWNLDKFGTLCFHDFIKNPPRNTQLNTQFVQCY